MAFLFELQHRIREGHPEISFAMMNGERPMTYSKNMKEGRLERLHLLAPQFSNIKKHLEAFPGANRDVLDAHACLWTAQRIASSKIKNISGGTGILHHQLRNDHANDFPPIIYKCCVPGLGHRRACECVVLRGASFLMIRIIEAPRRSDTIYEKVGE